MTGNLLGTEVADILGRFGVNSALEEIYTQCGEAQNDRFVSRERFWQYIEVLKKREAEHG